MKKPIKKKSIKETNKYKSLFDVKGVKIGDTVRIKIPQDYFVKETVNNPAHYGGKDKPYETIKVMKARLTREEFIGVMKFNVYKYNDRALAKDDELENYEKAQFYQNYLVSYLSK